MKHGKYILWPGLLFLVFLACGPRENANRPPEIRYGEDMCDNCKMIINEPRWAAAGYTTTGKALRFDDIGGIAGYLQTHPADTLKKIWLHDYYTQQWLRADSAVLVLSPRLKSPMAFGVAACGDSTSAARLAREVGGKLTDFRSYLQNPTQITASRK